MNPDKGYEVNAYEMTISTLKTFLVSKFCAILLM